MGATAVMSLNLEYIIIITYRSAYIKRQALAALISLHTGTSVTAPIRAPTADEASHKPTSTSISR